MIAASLSYQGQLLTVAWGAFSLCLNEESVSTPTPTPSPPPSQTPTPTPTPFDDDYGSLYPSSYDSFGSSYPTATPIPSATATPTPTPTPFDDDYGSLYPSSYDSFGSSYPTATPIPSATATPTATPTPSPPPSQTPTPTPTPYDDYGSLYPSPYDSFGSSYLARRRRLLSEPTLDVFVDCASPDELNIGAEVGQSFYPLQYGSIDKIFVLLRTELFYSTRYVLELWSGEFETLLDTSLEVTVAPGQTPVPGQTETPAASVPRL